MRLAALALAAIALSAASAPEPTAELSVTVSGLRSQRGAVRVCVTQNAKLYLKCNEDPKAAKRSAAAGSGAVFAFDGLEPGTYAVVVLHDENSNNKMDKWLAVPKEGFGFSRNPVIRMGPPKYEQVKIAIVPGHNEQSIRLKYML